MLAAFFTGEEQLELREVPTPTCDLVRPLSLEIEACDRAVIVAVQGLEPRTRPEPDFQVIELEVDSNTSIHMLID